VRDFSALYSFLLGAPARERDAAGVRWFAILSYSSDLHCILTAASFSRTWRDPHSDAGLVFTFVGTFASLEVLDQQARLALLAVVVAALFLAAGNPVCADGDGASVLGNGVTRLVSLGGQVRRDFCSEAARVVQRADISRRWEWGTSGVQAHPNLGSSFGQSVCVDTCPSERMNFARANRRGGRRGCAGGEPLQAVARDAGVWYGGAMPCRGLRNVVRCSDSGTVAGVWFQVGEPAAVSACGKKCVYSG